MEPDPMNNFRRRNATDTVTVERVQEVPSCHTKWRRGLSPSFSICYLLLIALISSSPNHLSADAQEIIVGKPFPSLQQKPQAPSPSPSPSSSPISPSPSSSSLGVVTGSPRPRQIAGNEWTPLPNPETKTETKTETETKIEIDEPKNSKNVLKATIDDNSEPASAPQAELSRRIGEVAEATAATTTATETVIAPNNSSRNNNSDSNNDLTSSATHYVGRQLTDPGFFSDNRPNTNVVNYQNPSSKNYAFAYGADDFAHQERRDGKVTIGEYTVALPDGRTQVVRYTSDAKAGFKADVSYDGEPNSQPGPGGKEPSYEAAPQQQQYFVSSSHPKTSGSSVKYSSQLQPSSPSISPQYEYIGPSPTPAYRQSRIKLHGHGHGGGGGGGGPSPSPQSYSPSQSPIFLSYPLKAQRPSVSPSLLYSKNQNSISIPNPSANPNSNPNVDVRIIDHHHYIDQHGNALTPSAGPPSPTPPSSIYESDPNYRYPSSGGQRPGPGPGPGPSYSPYILQSSPSVETINRGTPISFYPSAAPPHQSHSPSPSPSPNSLYYDSPSPSGIGSGGPTKITTILQRANTKLISHHNHSPHYGSSPSGAPPPEIPSPYKQIPHGYRAGPGPESGEEFEPEYITQSHYSHGGSSKTGGKPKRILIHGPGGSPYPYGADSSNSNIRFKQAKPDAPLLSHTYSHSHSHSSGNHHDFSVGVGNGNSRSSSSGSGRSGKNHGKPKSNLVPIEFFKAGPATKPPVPASALVYNYGGRGVPLLEEQSISQKQVYSPNTISSHFPSTYSPPLLGQGQELQPQTYFQAEDALSPSQAAQQQQQQLQEQQHQQHQHQLKQSLKYSPLHPQGGAVSSSSSEEQQFHQEQQVIRYVPNPQEQQQYISEPQPDQQQQAIDVNIAPVKSSVASYTIGHLGVTPKASLLYSSTDPGIPVGRAVHPSVGGLVYLEDPNHIQHSQHSSSSSSSSGGSSKYIGPPSSYPGSSGSDELPDAGPTTRPTAKEQRKGVKEAISRLPFIPPFPPKTQTYKVGAPDFGDSVSYSSKPTNSEEITSDGQGHYGDRDISSHGGGDPTHYQHVQDLPSNTLSSHHDGSLRKYYVQKQIDNSPSYVDSA